MKAKTLITTLATAAALTGFTATSHAITIGDTFDTGESVELGGVPFMVDYGSVEYVSDLSNGALRFNGKPGVRSTSISKRELVITGTTNLIFDWSVYDRSDVDEVSFYTINDVRSTLHDGIGMGDYSGTVSRILGAGTYDFQIISNTTNLEDNRYLLTVGNLRLDPYPESDQDPRSDVANVPDSSLGFLGIATIFAVMGAGRRFAAKRTS